MHFPWLAFLALDYTVQPLGDAPPADVPEAIRKELAEKGSRILKPDRTPFVDVWLRKSLPTVEPKQELSIKYTMIRPGTVIGLAKFHEGSADYKNQKFPAGVYTMRYMVQPEDGDHLGVSESRDFVLLCPAAAEKSVDPMGFEDAAKFSAKVSGKKHPSVLWLSPASDDKGPKLIHDEQNQRWLFECETPQSANGAPLRLAITVVGKSADF